MPSLEILFLSKEEIDALRLSLTDIMEAVEQGLRAHGEGKVVLPSKMHLTLEPRYNGHFNILPGYVEPLNVAGVKVIGDYVENYREGLPSELALLTLYRPETGTPFAIMDATLITWMRTGAVTAVGAKYLGPRGARILAHIGARGSAWYNVPMLDSLFDFAEIRVTSKRPESRERFAREVSSQLGKAVRAVATVEEAVKAADIIVDASRLTTPTVLVRDAWVKQGALLVPYGAVLSVEPTLPFTVDKFVVDDWAQAKRSEWGQFYTLIRDGKLRDEHVYGEIGAIVAGKKPGRVRDDERIIFWHKGFAISDIVVGKLAYDRATRAGLGQRLSYYRSPHPD